MNSLLPMMCLGFPQVITFEMNPILTVWTAPQYNYVTQVMSYRSFWLSELFLIIHSSHASLYLWCVTFNRFLFIPYLLWMTKSVIHYSSTVCFCDCFFTFKYLCNIWEDDLVFVTNIFKNCWEFTLPHSFCNQVDGIYIWGDEGAAITAELAMTT